MNFLGFLAPLLGIIMEWIYKLIPSYGWTLIIFTLLTKILMFPLSVKQQKSTARGKGIDSAVCRAALRKD